MTTEDTVFLESIEARVSRLHHGEYKGESATYRLSVEGETLTGSEMERVLFLMNKGDYVICPQSMNMGFKAGIVIATAEFQAPGLPLDSRQLLSFTDKQFPPEYSWNRLPRFIWEREI